MPTFWTTLVRGPPTCSNWTQVVCLTSARMVSYSPTISRVTPPALLTWPTVRSTDPVTAAPGARTQICSPTTAVTTHSGSSTSVPSARADSVNVYETTAIMDITDENDLILWCIYLCLILFFWERRVTQQCRKSFYCWHYVCLCLYPNHELYISLRLSKALISRWIIFISWTSLILPKSCQLYIIYSLSQQIFRCPSKKLPSLLRPSICFYFLVSFYELLFHFLCFFTI